MAAEALDADLAAAALAAAALAAADLAAADLAAADLAAAALAAAVIAGNCSPDAAAAFAAARPPRSPAAAVTPARNEPAERRTCELYYYISAISSTNSLFSPSPSFPFSFFSFISPTVSKTPPGEAAFWAWWIPRVGVATDWRRTLFAH